MSKLTTVFMDWPDDESGYIKATIRTRNVTTMLEKGWSRTWEAPETADAPPIAYVDDGDKGSGIPGSPEWHRIALAQMESKDEIVAYVVGVNGTEINKRGLLDTVRERALEALTNGNG